VIKLYAESDQRMLPLQSSNISITIYLDSPHQWHCYTSQWSSHCIYIVFALLFMVKTFVRVQK